LIDLKGPVQLSDGATEVLRGRKDGRPSSKLLDGFPGRDNCVLAKFNLDGNRLDDSKSLVTKGAEQESRRSWNRLRVSNLQAWDLQRRSHLDPSDAESQGSIG
jgi:hypothetical protein